MKPIVSSAWFYFSLVLIGIGVCEITHAKRARTIFLDDKTTAAIRVSYGRSTIINFPVKPNKVIVGNTGLFAVEYVENDLAISALTASSRSNLFVYLEGRRFGFDLRTVPTGGDEIVVVRDKNETTIKVRIKDE